MATAVLKMGLVFVWATCSLIVFATAQVAAQGETDLARLLIERLATPGDDEFDEGQFIPPSRESLRPLVTAGRLIREGKLAAAAVVLGEFLAEDEAPDFFIPLDSKTAMGARRAAHVLMGSLPDAACDDYRLKFAVVAQQQLDQAIEDLDRRALARLSSRYFFTAAGRQATMLHGHLDFSQGKLGEAEQAFRRLAADARRRQQYDPESWLMLATIHLIRGDEAAAERAVAELLDDRGLVGANSRDLEFLGEPLKLPQRADEGLAWLRQQVRSSTLLSGRPVDEWRMTRGTANHNAVSRSGLPMPWPEWSISLIDEDDAVGRSRAGLNVEPISQSLPKFFPIAAGDQVLARTVRGVSSFDLTTGALRWTWPPRMPVAIGAASPSTRNVTGEEANANRPSLSAPASVFDESFVGELTSDGKSLFVTPDTMPGPAKATADSFQSIGAVMAFDLAVQCLRAIDLRREGALRWQIGGLGGMDDAAYRGMKFLGVPLVIEERLYALADHESMIKLLVIHADSGQLISARSLAMSPPETEDHDDSDYLARAAYSTSLSPAFADGILVCPCRRGAVVGVSLDDLSLVWGYVPSKSQTITIPPYDYPARKPSNSNPLARWPSDRHHALIVEQGVVLYRPANHLGWTILDLFSGCELNRAAQSLRPELASSLFVAGIRDGKLLAVTPQAMHAWCIPSMQPLWTLDFEASETVSGIGFFSDQYYHLPLSSGRVLQIDLRDGTIAREVRLNEPLGNLIRHRGVLISQSATRLSMLLPEQTREVVASENPTGDPQESGWLLRARAQVLMEQGRFREALELLENMQPQGSQESPNTVFVDLYLRTVEQAPDWTSPGLRFFAQSDAGFAVRVLAQRIRGWATAHPDKLADRLLEHLPELGPDAWSVAVPHRDLNAKSKGGGAVQFDHFVGCVLGRTSNDLGRWPLLRNRFEAAGVPAMALNRLARSAEAEWNSRLQQDSSAAANAPPGYRRSEIPRLESQNKPQSIASSKFFRYLPRGLGDRSPSLAPVERSMAWTYHEIWPPVEKPDGVTIREILNSGLEFFDSRGNVLGRIAFQATPQTATTISPLTTADEITVEDSIDATAADVPNFDSAGGVCLRRDPWYLLLTQRSARMIFCEQNRWETAQLVWSKPIAIDLDRLGLGDGNDPAETANDDRRCLYQKAIMLDDANVILLSDGRLQSIALETGEVNWEVNASKRGRLISRARQVLVIDDVERSALVIDAGLGLPLEQVNLPEGTLCHIDRDVLLVERQRDGRRTLVGYSPQRNFAEIWSRLVEGTLTFVTGKRTVPAILGSDRNLDVLDPQTGETLLKIDLNPAVPANRTIHRLQIHRVIDRYLIILDTREPDSYFYLGTDANALQLYSISSEHPLRTGYMWAVDATTGSPVWDLPVRFEAMTWFLDADGNSPILAGGRKLLIQGRKQSFSEFRSHWYFIDLSNGRQIARVEGPATEFSTYRYLADISRGTATFLPGARRFSFELSDEPPAPGPHSHTSLRGSRLFRLPAFETPVETPETPPSRPKGLDRMREARDQEAKSRREIIEVFEHGGSQR